MHYFDYRTVEQQDVDRRVWEGPPGERVVHLDLGGGLQANNRHVRTRAAPAQAANIVVNDVEVEVISE